MKQTILIYLNVNVFFNKVPQPSNGIPEHPKGAWGNVISIRGFSYFMIEIGHELRIASYFFSIFLKLSTDRSASTNIFLTSFV